MSKDQHTYPMPALFGAALLSMVMGQVHAFSVFLGPLESHYGAARSQVSLSYSFSLIAITTSVLVGHRAYGLVAPPLIALFAGALALVGLFIAIISPGIAGVWIGFAPK